MTYIFEGDIFSEMINCLQAMLSPQFTFGTKSLSMNIDKNTVNTEQKRWYDDLRWKSLLWRSYLWSVQMPSTIKWCHNLVSSVAFSAGLIENTLEHVLICDWLASLSNRFKKWGINGSHIRYQSESFRVWCTVYTCTTLAIYKEGNKI